MSKPKINPKTVKVNPEQAMQIFQAENQRYEESTQKINALRGILNETSSAKEAIKGISNASQNEKAIVPVGAGIFLFAKIENNKEALLSFPGQAGIVKPIKEIESELEKRLDNIEKALEKEARTNQQIASNLNNLAMMLQQDQQRKK